MQRLYVLQQRMRRMPMFTAPVYSKLRPVERDFCEVCLPAAHTALKALDAEAVQ